jgi:hypothetical protein
MPLIDRIWPRHLASVAAAAAVATASLAAGLGVVATPAEAQPADDTVSAPELRGFFRDRDGDFTTIAPPRADGVKVGGLNDRGELVGIGYPLADRIDGGFGFLRDRRGRYATFLAPGTGPQSRTVGSDINNQGQIVGWSDDGRHSFGYLRDRHGAFEQIEHPNASGTAPDGLGGEFAGTEVRGINDRGDLVGNYAANRTVNGFVRHGRGTYTAIRPPRAVATLLTGINDRGDIVGVYSTIGVDDLAANPRAFVYNRGVYRDITVPGAVGAFANQINNGQQIAGAYVDGQGTTHGFVRHRDGDIDTVEHPQASGLGTAVYAINNKGELTGAYLSTGAQEPDPCDRGRTGHADQAVVAATLAAPSEAAPTPEPDCSRLRPRD